MHALLPSTAATFLLALSSAAQDPCWRLPARGAAEYTRTFATRSGVAATRLFLKKAALPATTGD